MGEEEDKIRTLGGGPSNLLLFVKLSDCLKTQSFNGSESMYGATKVFCFLLLFLLCDAQVLFCEIVCLGILQCANLYSSTFAKISVS